MDFYSKFGVDFFVKYFIIFLERNYYEKICNSGK